RRRHPVLQRKPQAIRTRAQEHTSRGKFVSSQSSPSSFPCGGDLVWADITPVRGLKHDSCRARVIEFAPVMGLWSCTVRYTSPFLSVQLAIGPSRPRPTPLRSSASRSRGASAHALLLGDWAPGGSATRNFPAACWAESRRGRLKPIVWSQSASG